MKLKEEEVQRVYLKHLVDEIKGNWGVWTCEIDLKDGRTLVGSIQGNEHMQAFETFELEDE